MGVTGRQLAYKMRQSVDMLLEPKNLCQSRPVQLSDVAASLQKRADQIDAWLSEPGSCRKLKRRHRKESAIERVYWHYGYTTAVRDVIEMLRRNGGLPS